MIACAAGRYGYNCSKECPNGLYGVLCEKNCTSCGNDCNKVTGCVKPGMSSRKKFP